MIPKKKSKPYWEMTTEELAEATKEFDEEFVAAKSRALVPVRKGKDIQAGLRASARQRNGTETISVRLKKGCSIGPPFWPRKSASVATRSLPRGWKHSWRPETESRAQIG